MGRIADWCERQTPAWAGRHALAISVSMIALGAATLALVALDLGADVAAVLLQLLVLPVVGSVAGFAIDRAWKRHRGRRAA